MKQNLYVYIGFPTKEIFTVCIAKSRLLCNSLNFRNVKMVVPSLSNFDYSHIAQAIEEQHQNSIEDIVKQVKGNAYSFGDCGLMIKSVNTFSSITPYESVILLMFPSIDIYAKLKKDIDNYSNVIMCIVPVNEFEMKTVFSEFNIIEINNLN